VFEWGNDKLFSDVVQNRKLLCVSMVFVQKIMISEIRSYK
jgi:hypothetical protein